MCHFSSEHLQRLALFAHVVVTLIVPCLHAGQSMGLHVAANLAVDAVGREEGLDTRTDAFELESFGGTADSSEAARVVRCAGRR